MVKYTFVAKHCFLFKANLAFILLDNSTVHQTNLIILSIPVCVNLGTNSKLLQKFVLEKPDNFLKVITNCHFEKHSLGLNQ